MVWCGHGNCQSESANEGADAESVAKAVEKLNAVVKEEME
jgi:hypothetical protein